MRASTAAGAIIGVGVLAALAYAVWKAMQATSSAASGLTERVGEATAAALQAVNPASDQNLAYRAANSVTQAVTGDSGTTLGVKLWEWFNPTQAANDAAITAPTPAVNVKGNENAGQLSGYWSQFTAPTYLDDMARAEKLNAMKNLRQVPPGTRSTDIWLVG